MANSNSYLPINQIVKYLVIFNLVVAPLSCDAEFSIRSQNVNGTNYLYFDDIATYFGMNIRGVDRDFSAYSDSYKIDFAVGSRKVSINSINAHFSIAPRLSKDNILISETDMTLLIDPILRVKALPRHSIQRIVIDPGHGGHDHGARGSRNIEKSINLSISKYLAIMLRNKGYDVLLTRDADTFISLKKRGVITRNWGGDLFISIHCNAVKKKHVTGIETYLVTPQGVTSTAKSKIQSRHVAGNDFDMLNARFAFELHKRLLSVTNAIDRGIKYNRFQVLREASCPAILVETGFLSNPNEENKLASTSYQKKIAISLANGVFALHNSLKNSR